MRASPIVVRTFVLLLLLLARPDIALAIPEQPGTLDTSFGSGGKVITPVNTSGDSAKALALQPDGKVVLAGYCHNGTDDDFCALRYNAVGTLDTSFGSGGKVVTPIGLSHDRVTGLALQPDGKLVLAGYCYNGANYDFCALRYLANGTLDTSFGSGGKVITPVNTSDDLANALALQPDGKLVLVGNCYNGANFDFCALRYLADGTLDTSFGSGGKVITAFGSSDYYAKAVALQPDGKLVLAGYCYNGANNDFCALRYNADGTLDASFGSGDKVITPVGTSNDQAIALALQPDGKLVLAGDCDVGSPKHFCALRYNADGTLDTSFGSGGKVITPIGTSVGSGAGLALQPDGKLVLAGYCLIGVNYDFCALRYLANGTLDASFGSSGKVITPVGTSDDLATALALQPDGKLVLAGYCSADFCAARYDGGPFPTPSCSLDIDGDGQMLATTDMLIGTRIALGITGTAVTNSISFPATAKRTTWTQIRAHLNSWCGMALP